MPNIIQFRLYLTKLLQKQNSSTFLWFTVYILGNHCIWCWWNAMWRLNEAATLN